MFIQTESTPNPATLKFLPGQSVMDMGTADFPSSDGASASPLAQRLFEVEGTSGVFLGSDFVTVTKTDAVDWDHIKPALLGAINCTSDTCVSTNWPHPAYQAVNSTNMGPHTGPMGPHGAPRVWLPVW